MVAVKASAHWPYEAATVRADADTHIQKQAELLAGQARGEAQLLRDLSGISDIEADNLAHAAIQRAAGIYAARADARRKAACATIIAAMGAPEA